MRLITTTLHKAGQPSATMLAIHDVILFIASLVDVALFGGF